VSGAEPDDVDDGADDDGPFGPGEVDVGDKGGGGG
jgi:hypothetical protein